VTKKRNPDDMTNEFRRTRRWILVLFVLFIPLLIGGLALNNLAHSEIPATLFAIVFFATLIFLSVRAFVSFYKMIGKYPFYWLKK
jgi:hypothetical protein